MDAKDWILIAVLLVLFFGLLLPLSIVIWNLILTKGKGWLP